MVTGMAGTEHNTPEVGIVETSRVNDYPNGKVAFYS
jgi:hypothetical protein